jgi:3-dehydroquinate synthase
VTITIPEGERAKSLSWVGVILDRLAAARFERQSIVVALGGGVIGDLAGFAAAVYARGIPFVQVPTTLVAQVDSSIGGKTGVNHRLGKNLIGAFHQPRLVLIDPDTLRTLPRREWVAGLAEVIKYGVIADANFFSYLEQRMPDLLRLDPDAIRRVVTRSCEIKAGVVMEDEHEADRRRILNYGHTVGHALESLSGYRRLIHGEAVAIGMAQEASLACSMGLCSRETVERVRALIRAAGLPDSPALRFQQLWGAMQHDKKVAQGTVYCVLPQQIGQVVVAPLARDQVRRWLAEQSRGQRRKRHGK